MKKYLLFCLCVCLSVSARAEYLDDKIATLTKQKLDLIAELEKCQKASGNLKIAGITTLGVSAIGIGANIAEAVALNKTEDKIDVANTELTSLNKEIQDIKAKKAAEEAIKPVVPSDSTPTASDTEIANCSPFTDCNSDANSQQLNAKTIQCAWGEYVATACADNTTGEQKQCKKSDGTTFTYYICTASQPVSATPRSYHSDCTAEETAQIPNAATSWWYNGKCVAKSCKEGSYLVVQGGNSQGYCVKSCSNGKITENWANRGGKACEITKKVAQEEIPSCGTSCSTQCDDNCLLGLDAVETVCVNGTHKPTDCYVPGGQIGEPRQCKNGDTVVTYYDACSEPPSEEEIPSCGTSCSTQCDDNCLLGLDATETVCVNGTHKPTDCYAGDPIGEQKQCKNGNTVVTYYDACPESSSENETTQNTTTLVMPAHVEPYVGLKNVA